jgi:hypothetical protein
LIDWGLPEIRGDMLYDGPAPTGVWCPGQATGENLLELFQDKKHDTGPGALLCFYRDDSRFERVYKAPYRYIETFRRYAAVVSPDFSVWRDEPLPVQLWAIYRSRWCSRTWQDLGIKCVPSLNWGLPNSYRFCFEGIPSGAPLVMCQCRTLRDPYARKLFLLGLAEAADRLAPKAIAIYGGQEHANWLVPRDLPKGPRLIMLPSWTECRRRKIKKGES